MESMTDAELAAEWLACERFICDPGDDANQVAKAVERQLALEAEQARRADDEGV